MLSAYLRELERELARRLPREDVQARLAEAEAHLRDGIEGRIELGMEPEAAEREAVEAFGPARSVARFVPEDRRLRWLVAFFGGLAFQYFSIRASVVFHIDLLSPAVVFLLDATIIGAALAYTVACFRVRRPALPSLLLGALLAVAVPIAYVRNFGHGGFGQGFRRMAYESPIEALDRAISAHPNGAMPLRRLRQAMVWGNDYRHELAFLVGGPLGVDLAFGGLGALAFAVRRRPQGGLRA